MEHFYWKKKEERKKRGGKTQQPPQHHLLSMEFSAALSSESGEIWESTGHKTEGVHWPQSGSLPKSYKKAECILVPSSVWCWPSNTPRPQGQNNQGLVLHKWLAVKIILCCRKKHWLGKGKAFRRANPVPALQIHYLIKSLNAPKTENYPHFTEEETVAQSFRNLPMVTNVVNNEVRVETQVCFIPKSLSSPPNPLRDPSYCPISNTFKESLTLQGFLKFFCEMI